MKEIGIGLLGFGTVGTGVVQGLQRHADLLAARLGARPVIRRIADIDLHRDRGVSVAPGVLTNDANAVIADPDIQIVIELIGGKGIAKSFILKALETGKAVVTANKALLAEHGAEIFELAARKQTDIYFGASVGGGIPIIRVLREGLVANRIEGIQGILNGTCNYILTRMEIEGLAFDKALQEAQAQGYAEADPSLDIDGVDTAHKAVILAALAYGMPVPMSAVHIEGIRHLAQCDTFYARDLGYRIKLLAVIRLTGQEVEVRVHPTLVPLNKMLASVSGVFNAVMVRGDMTGDTVFYGRGAGSDPTASTVISDVADIVRNLAAGRPRHVPVVPPSGAGLRLRTMADIETRYYLRLNLLDRPGVLARISAALGEHSISIASVMQKEGPVADHVPVVIVTHRAREKEMNAALATIDRLDVVGAPAVRLRIEE